MFVDGSGDLSSTHIAAPLCSAEAMSSFSMEVIHALLWLISYFISFYNENISFLLKLMSFLVLFIYTKILEDSSANSADLDQGLLESLPSTVWHSLGQPNDRTKLDFPTLYVCMEEGGNN